METFLLYSNILLWIVQLLVIFALVVLFRQFGEIYLNSADAISRDGIPIGDYIPEFVGEDFSTTRAVTHKDLEGRPTLLAFISPNCDACRDLIPEWNQCCLDHREKVNFVLMGVGDREKMEAFCAGKGDSRADRLGPEGSFFAGFPRPRDALRLHPR